MGLESQPGSLPDDGSAAPSDAAPDDVAVWAPSSSWESALVTTRVMLRREEPARAAAAQGPCEAGQFMSFDWASWVRRRRDLARSGNLL